MQLPLKFALVHRHLPFLLNHSKYNNLEIHCKRNKMSTFCMNDYDCVGFDLDNTLARYKLPNLLQLVYSTLNKFLVENKSYPKELMTTDKQYDEHFIQKGLILDARRGNLLKISDEGEILRASHGTKMLSSSEISNIYGTNRHWEHFEMFRSNLFEGRGKTGKEIRCFKDYFDITATLVAARIVDVLDKNRTDQNEDNFRYQFWPDILDGLIDMYKVEGFSNDNSAFFKALKADVEKYVMKCSEEVRIWLKNIRSSGKIVFMVTGSNYDFATHLATHCLGADWRDYFDLVVTYAGKPGFFNARRDFLYLNGESLDSINQIQRGEMYRRGNYTHLVDFFIKITGLDDPRVVYFGDNLVQDVFTPAKYCRCDTVAVVEEMEHEFGDKWGSFFFVDTNKITVNSGTMKINTLWAKIILTHSKICIPHLDSISILPLTTKIPAFCINKNSIQSGFYPHLPKCLSI